MTQEWRERWREGRIGFHRRAVHPALTHYWPRLGIRPGTQVLVPLCGKSLDMRWLASRDYAVLGIELAPEAIEQYLAEGRGAIAREQRGAFSVSRQGSVELWCGDFFHLHTEHVAEVGAFYDRASLIALPPGTRQRYAFHLAQLTLPGTVGLLITLTRPAENPGGPPFSVEAAEVRELFEPNFAVTYLEEGEPEADSGFRESVWALIRRGPRQ